MPNPARHIQKRLPYLTNHSFVIACPRQKRYQPQVAMLSLHVFPTHAKPRQAHTEGATIPYKPFFCYSLSKTKTLLTKSSNSQSSRLSDPCLFISLNCPTSGKRTVVRWAMNVLVGSVPMVATDSRVGLLAELACLVCLPGVFNCLACQLA